MTGRQARKLIYAVIEANKNRFNDDTLEALEMGRTALEQPTMEVLDKIMDEIDGIEINGQVDEHTMFIRSGEQVKQMALAIIDHYTKGDAE